MAGEERRGGRTKYKLSWGWMVAIERFSTFGILVVECFSTFGGLVSHQCVRLQSTCALYRSFPRGYADPICTCIGRKTPGGLSGGQGISWVEVAEEQQTSPERKRCAATAGVAAVHASTSTARTSRHACLGCPSKSTACGPGEILALTSAKAFSARTEQHGGPVPSPAEPYIQPTTSPLAALGADGTACGVVHKPLSSKGRGASSMRKGAAPSSSTGLAWLDGVLSPSSLSSQLLLRWLSPPERRASISDTVDGVVSRASSPFPRLLSPSTHHTSHSSIIRHMAEVWLSARASPLLRSSRRPRMTPRR
eukprot:scaffold243671_cov35-Tisochrysis_lutea.AAC.1